MGRTSKRTGTRKGRTEAGTGKMGRIRWMTGMAREMTGLTRRTTGRTRWKEEDEKQCEDEGEDGGTIRNKEMGAKRKPNEVKKELR